MPRKSKELSALEVARLAEPGLHFVGGVAGLAMQVQPSGARSWVLRFSVAGKRREMGLGGFPDVTLADARRRAREEREKADKGTDPIAERKAAASQLRAERARAFTFKASALAYIEAHEPGWRNAKHADQWRNTLASTYPAIGAMQVRDVGLPQVLKVLEPIWRTKTETASRLRGRIESVLDWATARGYRDGLNPARWKGHLDHLLPAPGKIMKTGHHAAVAVGEVGAFMQALRAQPGVGARALEFVILTAARSGEVRGATWSEVDLDAAMWTVPGERMKAGKEHRVPLSGAALELLRQLPRMAGTDLVFPAPRGGVMSDMTLVAVVRRMEVDAVPHGFRSTFRDWCSERTNYAREVAEMALAHSIGDKVEAAYRRGDLLEKRAVMMSEWAAFLAKPEADAKVIPMQSKRA
ncbi:MAG TPA: integrase arm-type DNA-binding domain-containing protein [Burkholderiaceae bacterium]